MTPHEGARVTVAELLRWANKELSLLTEGPVMCPGKAEFAEDG